jgi:uroporphyrin-III C-methyltransferase
LSGTVYLVGAGPGAPDLLTLRAARLLERADIVFHDALVHPGTLELAERAEKVAVGKRCGAASTAQRFINRRLVEAARKHQVVVRLKGGDPMLFGRAAEELAALDAAGIAWEVVPGITAALAAAAEIGASLTERGRARSVVFATPRVAPGEAESDWVRTAATADTAVLYMGLADAREIALRLIEAGVSPDKPVAVIAEASLDGARKAMGRLCDLEKLARRVAPGPAVIVIGEVLRRALRAAQSTALSDRTARTRPATILRSTG